MIERPLDAPPAGEIRRELDNWRLRERVVGGSHRAQELRARAKVAADATEAYLRVIEGDY